MGRKWTEAEKEQMRQTMLAKYGKGTGPVKSQVKKVEPIGVPNGSEPTLPGTEGECVCCGKEFKGQDTIRRCAHVNAQGYKTGYRVCRNCSPYMTDLEVTRYALDFGDWEEGWKSGKTKNTFGDKTVIQMPYEEAVTELNKFEDEEFDKSEFIPKDNNWD